MGGGESSQALTEISTIKHCKLGACGDIHAYLVSHL
jgi:hypothetical protein